MRTLHVLRLIELLAQKTGQSKDHYGFGIMADKIDEPVSQKYLDDLYRNVRRLQDKSKESIRASGRHLDAMARYLEYETFMQFSISCEASPSGILASCAGNWWSYVRANAGEYLLKAPVKLFLNKKSQRFQMELRGKDKIFSGEVEEKGLCLFTFLRSQNDKQIGLVFKLGDTKKMTVLKGVFCGMSSSGDPIAGREILVHEPNMKYDQMTWSQHNLDDKTVDERIRKYFSEYDKNCIKIKHVSSFDMGDLDEDK